MVRVGSTGVAVKQISKKTKNQKWGGGPLQTPQRDFVNRSKGCVNIIPVFSLVSVAHLGTQQKEITPQSTK